MTAIPAKTPNAKGLFMPAEWERHEAIWLAWPHDPETFPGRVEAVEGTYARIVSAIHHSEDVHLFVKNEAMERRVSKMLFEHDTDLTRVYFHMYDYADVWFRDYGPIFVTDKDKAELAMVHWKFNAWGGKYPELMRDTEIPKIINQDAGLEYYAPGIVLEGGSIDVNGKGTVLTTEQCLLNRNRNPHLKREQIEEYLKEYLGAWNVVWLKEGIAGDDTDGHIDDIARFVNATTVLCAWEEDPRDENYKALKENFEFLQGARDQEGKRLNVLRLPTPGYVGDGRKRLPASYANFYIGNSVVLVPTFGHANDAKAFEMIQRMFPERKAIGIPCEDLIHGMGTLHCISQQQPGIIGGVVR